MIKVYVKKQSNYPVNAAKIKAALVKFFEIHGIVSDSQVTVSIVGEKKATDVAREYLGGGETAHNVLSFSSKEIKGDKKFIYPSSESLDLGEIVICYQVAVKEAKKESKRIDRKMLELAEHGAMHLMGIHHK